MKWITEIKDRLVRRIFNIQYDLAEIQLIISGILLGIMLLSDFKNSEVHRMLEPYSLYYVSWSLIISSICSLIGISFDNIRARMVGSLLASMAWVYVLAASGITGSLFSVASLVFALSSAFVYLKLSAKFYRSNEKHGFITEATRSAGNFHNFRSHSRSDWTHFFEHNRTPKGKL